jgi:hypothetical protein
VFAVAAVCVVLAAAACGGSDGDSGTDIGGVDPEERDREQPQASEGTSVAPYIQALLDEHSAAVDEILSNPQVARDPDSPAVQRYVELYEPDSDVPDQVMEAWVEAADRGERARPSDPDQPMNILRIDGEVDVVAEDEVTFPVCDEQRLVVEDADGNVVDDLTYEPLRGEGTAVHVEGRWFLRRIDLAADPVQCGTEAEVEASVEGSGSAGTDEGGSNEDGGGDDQSGNE